MPCLHLQPSSTPHRRRNLCLPIPTMHRRLLPPRCSGSNSNNTQPRRIRRTTIAAAIVAWRSRRCLGSTHPCRNHMERPRLLPLHLLPAAGSLALSSRPLHHNHSSSSSHSRRQLLPHRTWSCFHRAHAALRLHGVWERALLKADGIGSLQLLLLRCRHRGFPLSVLHPAQVLLQRLVRLRQATGLTTICPWCPKPARSTTPPLLRQWNSPCATSTRTRHGPPWLTDLLQRIEATPLVRIDMAMRRGGILSRMLP